MVGGPCCGEARDLIDEGRTVVTQGSHFIFDNLWLTPRAMTTSGLTAISAFQVVGLSKNQIRAVHVVIDTLNQGSGLRLWEAAHSWTLPEAVVKKNLMYPILSRWSEEE